MSSNGFEIGFIIVLMCLFCFGCVVLVGAIYQRVHYLSLQAEEKLLTAIDVLNKSK